MPSLRSLNTAGGVPERRSANRLLRKPHTWLGLLLLLSLLFVADSFRPPSRQVSVRVFAAGVDGYHSYLHPVTGRFIRCRYQPTCSRYSVEAVRKYGIAKGLALSVHRIRSCRSTVPWAPGTQFPSFASGPARRRSATGWFSPEAIVQPP